MRLGLEYLDQLARDATADASLQLQLASGYIKLGRAQWDNNGSHLGDRSGAVASYRKAVEILDRLHAAHPQDS